MSDVRFSEPATYAQLEAIGGFYKALFELAEAYGITEPYKLIKEHTWHTPYQIEELLKKQKEAGEIKVDGELTDKKDEPAKGTPDDPINLDDIPF